MLTVGYDRENLTDPLRRGAYGERSPPTGMAVLFQSMHTVPGIWISPPPQPESSGEAAAALFDRIADPGLLVRRLYVTAGRAVPEENIKKKRFMNSWICLPIIWR